jgi:hypothetical protein
LTPLPIAAQVYPKPLVTQPIDESRLVSLRGTVHPLANAANDRGAAPDSMQLERLHLVLKRSPEEESALRQFIADAHAANSPTYHKWLTPEEFGRQFGPADQDIATVESWLQSHGFSIAQVNPGKQTLEFSGTVGQFRSAFHAQIHRYEVNGETYYANAGDPSIPAGLSPVVGGFVSLNNFRLKSYTEKLGEASYNLVAGRAKPSWTIGGGTFDYQNYNFVLSPADFAVQYDLNKLYNATGTFNNATGPINGTGETIAIINDSNINTYLVNQFRKLFSLPANPPQVIIDGNDPGIDGINSPNGPNGDSVEAYLDVEWSGAVAPDATIDLVIAADTQLESGLFLAMERAVYANVAPILSLSFGNCEKDLSSSNQFINQLWEQAAAQGQTVIVSTGDSGPAGCDDANSESFALYGQAVNGFASTPFNVAVGGTDFYYSSFNSGDSAINAQLGTYWNTTASNTTPTLSIKGVIPEQPWNDSQFGDNLFSYYSEYDNTTIAAGSGGASNCADETFTQNCGGSPSGYYNGGYLKPSWQSPTTVTGVPNDGVRDLPDVSLFAANGQNDSYYPICATDGDCTEVNDGYIQIFGVGGTSASAPSFAGIMALVDQSMANSGNPDGRQGQADYILYPLFAQFQSGATPPYNDVTVGTNSVPCDYTDDTPDCIQIPGNDSLYYTLGYHGEGQIGGSGTAWYNAYSSGSGYSMATGLGTIDAYNLVSNWANVTLTTSKTSGTLACGGSPCPSGISLDTPVTLSGSVTGNTTYPPTGTVALMTDSTEPLNAGQTSTTLTSGSSPSYTMTYSDLPGGTYNIWVNYSGDSNNAPSSSTPISVTVDKAASTIIFNAFSQTGTYYAAGASIGNVDYGTRLELSAIVAPTSQASSLESCMFNDVNCSSVNFPEPTGTITFTDNGNAIDTALLDAGGDADSSITALLHAGADAEFSAPFALGSHSVTASYSGDQSYNAPSSPSAIHFTVVQDTPDICTFTSTYSPININGTCNITYSSALIGTNQASPLTVNLYNHAVHNPDNAFAVFPVPVAPPSGTVTISGSVIPSLNTTVTLSHGVDPYTYAVMGTANFTIPATTPSGTYNYNLAYSGDTNYVAESKSGEIVVTNVNSNGLLPSTTTATLSATATSPTSGIILSGTVTGQAGHPAPTGGSCNCVYVYSSGYITTIGLSAPSSGDVSSFNAEFNSQSLLQGANFITVQYPGDTNYNPSAAVLGTAVSNPLSDFTLVPSTPLVAIDAASSSSGADNLYLTSVNGMSGAVTLTCTPASGIQCSFQSNSETLASAGNASDTLTIDLNGAANGTYNVLVTATWGSYIHTAAIQVVVSGAVGFVVTNSGAITISPGATTANTSTITVSPTGGFTGTVNLSCAVTGSPSDATSPVTCSIPLSVDITDTNAQTAALTVASTSSTTTGRYDVTVTAQSGGIIQSTVVNVTVTGPATLSLTPGTPSPASVSPGGSSTVIITFESVPGFSGTVTLACSAAPGNETDTPGCSLSPNQVTYTNGTPSPTTVTATVTTTAASNANLVYPKPVKGKGWMDAGGGAVLAVLVFLWIPAWRRNWRSLLGLLIVMTALGSLSACGSGGGGDGGGGGNSGTSAGTYTFTVTASGTNVSSSSTTKFTLIVN